MLTKKHYLIEIKKYILYVYFIGVITMINVTNLTKKYIIDVTRVKKTRAF